MKRMQERLNEVSMSRDDHYMAAYILAMQIAKGDDAEGVAEHLRGMAKRVGSPDWSRATWVLAARILETAITNRTAIEMETMDRIIDNDTAGVA